MKKILLLLLALVLVISLSACGKTSDDSTADLPALPTESPVVTPEVIPDEPVKPVFSSSLDIESIPEDAAMIGHVSCFDASGKVLWNYDTDKIYVSQLETIQEIGFTSYGYLLIEDGTVTCIGLENDKMGKVLWRNDSFGGGSASWDFDEDENLYICGYFGPELCIIDPNGATVARFEPSMVDECYWPYSLEYDDGYVFIEYESNELKVKMDPRTGRFEDFVLENDEDLQSLIYGTWVDHLTDPRFIIAIDPDGTYLSVRYDADEGWMSCGEWDLDKDRVLALPLTDYDDPLFSQLGTYGDFKICDFDAAGGRISMKLEQQNNGDSLASLFFGEYTLYLYKYSAGINYDNLLDVPEAGYNYYPMIGDWRAVSAEIEGWEYDPAEEGMEIILSVMDDGTAYFSCYHEEDWLEDELFLDMPVMVIDEELYDGIDTDIYGPWCVYFEADEENCFFAAMSGPDSVELFWYQGEWTDEVYPAVLWVKLDRF